MKIIRLKNICLKTVSYLIDILFRSTTSLQIKLFSHQILVVWTKFQFNND